jgi:hypothetical protein
MKFREDNLQKAVACYLDHLPNVVWFHVANERKTSIQAGKRLKDKGVKSGVPDVMILNAENGFCGLAIELKVKGGRLTHNQKTWLVKLENIGYKTAVCFCLQDAIDVVNEYFAENQRIVKL